MARQSALEVRKLGKMPYADALQIQQTLVRQRRDNEVSDVLLLVEHPHVVTLGVNARHRLSNLLVTPAQLSAMGVELHDVTRGGDVTYHGPGQLVGYPILDLRPDRCDVHRYVRDLETVIMRTVLMFGVRSSRMPGLTGVWVGDDKLAAIGVRLSRWVTSHGFSLNVSTDLTYFDLATVIQTLISASQSGVMTLSIDKTMVASRAAISVALITDTVAETKPCTISSRRSRAVNSCSRAEPMTRLPTDLILGSLCPPWL